MTNDIMADIRRLAQQTQATRKTNNMRSGRASRRAYYSNSAVKAVGGFRNVTQAIYAPSDPWTGEPAKLCNVVPRETGYVRDNVGNVTSTPFRNPQQVRSLGGRGIN